MGGLQGLEFATSGRTATRSCQVIIFAVVGHRGRARGHKGLYTCSRLFPFELRMAKLLAPQLLCELIFTPLRLVFSPASPLGLSTPAPPVVCSGRLMGGPGWRWSPGGPTCRSADGDVPARCRFGDVTAHSRLGVDVTVSGDVTKLGGAGPLAHSVYSPRGCMAGHGRRGGSADQRRGERHRGPTGSVCPWGGQTLRHPAGAVKSTAWVHHHVALGDGVYASLPLWRHRPTKLDGLPSALEWRMMLRAAHGGRRPLPSPRRCKFQHILHLIF